MFCNTKFHPQLFHSRWHWLTVNFLFVQPDYALMLSARSIVSPSSTIAELANGSALSFPMTHAGFVSESDICKEVVHWNIYAQDFYCNLEFKEHIDCIMTKVRKGLAVINMAGADFEQWLLVLLYHGLVPSGIDYALVILPLKPMQIRRLWKVESRATCVILGCSTYASCKAKRY